MIGKIEKRISADWLYNFLENERAALSYSFVL
jgi:hypothetical protein